MRLLTAVNGRLGIEIARASQPEVILMDINLPGISGIEALKILREDPATAHIPVVALSANAMPRDIEKGLEAGFFRYLTKPIKVNEFMDTLDVALEFAAKGLASASEAGAHAMISSSDILNARILIVDDQEANVLLLERMLRGAGYASIASTTDPREVCELHRKNRYDLILLDLQMPGMDGFQVMEGLKEIETERLPSCPRDHRPTGSQAARAASRREGFRQQTVRSGGGAGRAFTTCSKSACCIWKRRNSTIESWRSRRCRSGCCSTCCLMPLLNA